MEGFSNATVDLLLREVPSINNYDLLCQRKEWRASLLSLAYLAFEKIFQFLKAVNDIIIHCIIHWRLKQMVHWLSLKFEPWFSWLQASRKKSELTSIYEGFWCKSEELSFIFVICGFRINRLHFAGNSTFAGPWNFPPLPGTKCFKGRGERK